MDAAWKVYVGDRRFDDNQISNLFLKLKYETVGRFTFDFRPIDGDESYMVVGNTLRIFWGDLHRLDGVIQRVDWDDTLYCYHVFGADIRGFLLDRVNTEPSTVSSYTSDVQTQVMYTGCDFPSNIWTGAGDRIGKYTFHYRLSIQNTIRITSATLNRWENVIERGTVTGTTAAGCIQDATKNWVPNEHRGRVVRFVSGACKNNVYMIGSNSASAFCIGPVDNTLVQIGTVWKHNYAAAPVDGSTWDNWILGQDNRIPYQDIYNTHNWYPPLHCTAEIDGDTVHLTNTSPQQWLIWDWVRPASCPTVVNVSVSYKVRKSVNDISCGMKTGSAAAIVYWVGSFSQNTTIGGQLCNPSYPAYNWTNFGNTQIGIAQATSAQFMFDIEQVGSSGGDGEIWLKDLVITSATSAGTTTGPWRIPACSRIGDIYEIVFASMVRIDPATAAVDLVKDEHVIQYNETDDLGKHITSMVVRGAEELLTPPTYPEGWHWPWES